MSNFDIELYKIKNIVDGSKDDHDVNTIDFTIDLAPDYALDKRLERDLNFRPLYATYYDQEIDYARRRFDFQFSPSGLMVDRKEWLSYYLNDGSLGQEFLIKHRSYNHSNPEEFQMAIDEAVSLRKDIVGHIKTIISQVVFIGNPTFSLQQVIATTDPFFQELTNERLAFVDIGSSSYRLAIDAIDLQTTPHVYLAAPMPQGGTLKDYIVSLT